MPSPNFLGPVSKFLETRAVTICSNFQSFSWVGSRVGEDVRNQDPCNENRWVQLGSCSSSQTIHYLSSKYKISQGEVVVPHLPELGEEMTKLEHSMIPIRLWAEQRVRTISRISVNVLVLKTAFKDHASKDIASRIRNATDPFGPTHWRLRLPMKPVVVFHQHNFISRYEFRELGYQSRKRYNIFKAGCERKDQKTDTVHDLLFGPASQPIPRATIRPTAASGERPGLAISSSPASARATAAAATAVHSSPAQLSTVV
ncbi:unnamed protein product [Nesidiocoris tenuis]|uniref:Uncharacterized protein n=1 Tax=Nesidiocoris tenuis TaxID=355587 RepID=A0A6H5HH54_9HEMI|nr:unnamed protein product [Nesidiocoris tenuis]